MKCEKSRQWPLLRIRLLTLCVLATALVTAASPARAAQTAAPCSEGTWTRGEVSVYWFDAEQGDSQLIVGPTGKTMLIDLGEKAFNSTGTTTAAVRVAEKIKIICGTGSSPVALDYVMVSHHHLDHTGYPGNPADLKRYGNGLYQLLTPNGLGFTVGSFIDHDGGSWVDTNHDGRCDIGTATEPSDEIEWHNAGTTSQTSRRLICWLYGPAGQADRRSIEGRVATLTNTAPWPVIDLGPGVRTTIVGANGKGVMKADGVTPISGNHTTDKEPPSENDYGIAFKLEYGKWAYATAGDVSGEYNRSAQGYTYSDVETVLGPQFGNVDTLRANHHGSGHSSNQQYLETLKPETVFISCGKNGYGHPSDRVLDALHSLSNDNGTVTDIYLANNPCNDTEIDGTFNHNGDVILRTTDAGAGYGITYDRGTKYYIAHSGQAAEPGQW